MASAKLRILCLHGYTQTAQQMSDRIGQLRKATKTIAEYIFIDAPLPAFWETEGQEPEERGKAWYTFSKDRTEYFQVDEALDYVERAFITDGPFDGILGFSQGAFLASLIASKPERFPTIRFAMIFCGFYPSCVKLQQYFEGLILTNQVKTFHVFGTEDKLIPTARSQQLADRFPDAQTYIHGDGHHIPLKAEHKKVYVDFIESMHALLKQEKA